MKTSTGALIDTRTLDQKAKDYLFEEIVSSPDLPVWVEKNENDWRKFPILNQKASNQCVAFTLRKMLGIQHLLDYKEYVDFSASHIYERRANYPSAGMNGIDSMEIVRKSGVTLEELYPSKTENNDYNILKILPQYSKVGEVFKIGAYLSVPVNIDTIASIIQRTGKGIMMFIFANSQEWKREVPIIKDKNLTVYKATVRHAITATDFFLYNGKKALLIEDSWGVDSGKEGRRIITEDFFNKRCWFCAHIMNFKFDSDELKDKEQTFNVVDTATFGDKSENVVQIQEMLKYEGLFPKNIQSTGYYGSITAKAVLQWQLKHKVDTPIILNNLGGKYFGSKSLKIYKNIYK